MKRLRGVIRSHRNDANRSISLLFSGLRSSRLFICASIALCPLTFRHAVLNALVTNPLFTRSISLSTCSHEFLKRLLQTVN